MSMPFSLYVNASDYAVGACLTQQYGDSERTVAFASCKFDNTQQRWATVHKEAYAALWALKKFKHWLFGGKVILNSDHNPLVFLT
jgi:RNase H-like domain found in reverse transcriptase